MRLRTGITANSAIKSLTELEMGLGNLASVDVPSPYLEWVERAETQFRHLFVDDTLAEGLQSTRYFHIRQLIPNSIQPRKAPFILAEVDLQKKNIQETITQLKSYSSLAERPGYPLVLDTNAFMHYTIFKDIDWAKEFEHAQVRLIVPLIVLDELDDKTFSHNKRIAKRADQILRTFDLYMEDLTSEEIVNIRGNVSIEILKDDVSHQRRTSNDSEIIDRAQFLHQVIESPVTMVTGDRGLRVRCHARQIPVKMMPPLHLLPLGE